MVESNPERKRIKSTDKALDIIEFIHKKESCTLDEMATELELAKSTIHAHLVTLIDRNYVIRTGSRYRTGLRFLEIGAKARQNIDVFKQIKPLMERLTTETNERTQFMVEEQGWGIHIYRAESSWVVPTNASIGKRNYLHTSSTGKAILAEYPEERIKDIIDMRGLPALTENTITDRSDLFEELETIQQRGYATNKGESISNLWALGTSITGESGEVVGAISIGGPTHRMKESDRFKKELPSKLLAAAEEIELNISYS